MNKAKRYIAVIFSLLLLVFFLPAVPMPYPMATPVLCESFSRNLSESLVLDNLKTLVAIEPAMLERMNAMIAAATKDGRPIFQTDGPTRPENLACNAVSATTVMRFVTIAQSSLALRIYLTNVLLLMIVLFGVAKRNSLGNILWWPVSAAYKLLSKTVTAAKRVHGSSNISGNCAEQEVRHVG
jgi:hypothetical protein